jgi:flagellar assembly protein FliH
MAITEATEDAYQRGFLEGQKSAEIEVERMMSHALGLLTQVTQSFAAQVDGAIEELATSIEASVLSLAASRAGTAIDAVPEAFLQRIKTLADRIYSSATHPIVRLNPLDLLVLKPILEQSQDLLNLRLVSDANLQRGDIDLSLEGIRLTDLLPRVDQPAQDITYTPLVLAADIVLPPTPPKIVDTEDEAQPIGDPTL